MQRDRFNIKKYGGGIYDDRSALNTTLKFFEERKFMYRDKVLHIRYKRNKKLYFCSHTSGVHSWIFSVDTLRQKLNLSQKLNLV